MARTKHIILEKKLFSSNSIEPGQTDGLLELHETLDTKFCVHVRSSRRGSCFYHILNGAHNRKDLITILKHHFYFIVSHPDLFLRVWGFSKLV